MGHFCLKTQYFRPENPWNLFCILESHRNGISKSTNPGWCFTCILHHTSLFPLYTDDLQQVIALFQDIILPRELWTRFQLTCCCLFVGVTKWVPKWKSSGWKSASGGSVINREELELLEECSSGLKVTYVSMRKKYFFYTVIELKCLFIVL